MNRFTDTTCKLCNVNFTSSRGLSQHITKAHRTSLRDYIIKVAYEGKEPVCGCGCGEKVSIRGFQVMEYVNGHSPRGRFTLGVTPQRSETWKKNLKTGIQKALKQNKEKDASYRCGEKNNFYGRKHTEATKKVIQEKVEKQIAEGRHPFIGNNNGRIAGSSLEDRFAKCLETHSVNYTRSFKIPYVPEGKTLNRYKYYDFCLPETKTIIEIHGSYWHPKTIEECKSQIQLTDYKNDIFKKRLAEISGYRFVVVYDTHLEDVIKNFPAVLTDEQK